MIKKINVRFQRFGYDTKKTFGTHLSMILVSGSTFQQTLHVDSDDVYKINLATRSKSRFKKGNKNYELETYIYHLPLSKEG